MSGVGSKGVSGKRISPALTRVDAFRARAKRLKEKAAVSGDQQIIDLAEFADTCGFNARSGYEAAQIGDTGGSSRSFSLRNRGAMWLKKGQKAADEVDAMLTTRKGEEQ